MQRFQHIVAPFRLYQGDDSLSHLERELDRLNCKRAVIFCGQSLVRSATELVLIHAALGDRCVGLFSGVCAHSRLRDVETAAQELKRIDADAIVSVGGGSSMVTARAASILLAEHRDAASLATSMDVSGKLISPRLLAPKLPQFVVPTTPTTAMVKAGSAVYDPASGKRLALFDPKTRAQSIFIHPALAGSAPARLVVTASLNTFALAVEGLLSPVGDPLADALLMHAVRLISKPLLRKEPGSFCSDRAELMLAAVLCGQGTDYTGAGLTAVIGHAIGARHGLENGLLNAIVLPHALRFNARANREGFEKLAVALGSAEIKASDAAEAVIAAIDPICSMLGLPERLRDLGLGRDAIAEIAALSMGDWFLRNNARPLRSASEIEEVITAAW